MPRSHVSISRPLVSTLIDQARNGSHQASGELLEACRDYLLLIANRQLEPQLRQKIGASDLVQETCIRAQDDFVRFQGGSERELLAWLRKILLNRIAQARREFVATAKRDINREIPIGGDGSTRPRGVQVVCPQESPSRQVSAREDLLRVEAAIARLPPQYAEVIRLYVRERLRFDAIGERLGIGSDAARKLWARAVERLQRELKT